MRIIQIYLQVNNIKLTECLKLKKEILQYICYSHNHNYHLIIMGDFNIDIDDLSINHQHKATKFHFINQLKELDLVDSYNLISQNNYHKSYQNT